MSDEINQDAFEQVKELMGEKFPILVETYLRSTRDHVEKLRQGFEAQSAKTIADSAHAMKSSSGNMGLVGLSASASELEAKAREAIEGGLTIDALGGLITTIESQFASGETFLKQF